MLRPDYNDEELFDINKNLMGKSFNSSELNMSVTLNQKEFVQCEIKDII